jgi:hypothetical protein
LSDLIILADSSSDISEIKKLSHAESSLVVSFDHDFHKQLDKDKINHVQSDEFLSEDDVDNIQKTAYRLIRWYDENEIQKFINYESINIGKLFHEELMDYFVKFIKSFFEINLIYKKYPNASFYSSPNFYKILEIFTSNIHKLSSYSTSTKYANDNIRINFNIGKKSFMFFISKSTYQTLKSFYEKFIHLVMGSKSLNPNKKNILLVEFNTVRFEEFFLANKSKSLQLYFYGRRRPAFWNYNSYSIFKKSKAKIVSPHSVDHKTFESSLNDSISFVKKNIQSLWQNEKFLTSFFSINNISIWNFIKPTFFELLENRIENTIYEIELSKNLLDTYHFDNILLLSEIGLTEQIIAGLAKKNNIPLTLIQPGLYYDTAEANEMNVSQTVYPVLSDRFVVWGQIAKDDSLTNGNLSSDRVETIGSPRYDKKKLSVDTSSQDYILLATSAPQPADIHGLLSKNIENYENSIIQISEIAKKLKKPLIIKLHASPNEPDVNALISKIDHDITVITAGDIFSLIQSCSVMIVLGLSTAIVEAQILHKPVISVAPIDYKWGNPEVFKSNSCLISNMNSLEDDLTKVLHNKNFSHDIVNRADSFIDNYFVNLGLGPEKIFNYLSKI